MTITDEEADRITRQIQALGIGWCRVTNELRLCLDTSVDVETLRKITGIMVAAEKRALTAGKAEV